MSVWFVSWIIKAELIDSFWHLYSFCSHGFSVLTAFRMAPMSTASFCGWKPNLLLFSRTLGVSNLACRLGKGSQMEEMIRGHCWYFLWNQWTRHYGDAGDIMVLDRSPVSWAAWLPSLVNKALFIFVSVSQHWVLEARSNKLQPGTCCIFLRSLMWVGGGQRTADHFLDFSCHPKTLF